MTGRTPTTPPPPAPIQVPSGSPVPGLDPRADLQLTYQHWWSTVCSIHALLAEPLPPDADEHTRHAQFEQLRNRYAAEATARAAYAAALSAAGRPVPEELGPQAPLAPIWPVAPPPG